MPQYPHSRLSTFEQCNLKFKFKYIDKVETEAEEGVEAFLGQRVHEALKKLYSDLKFEKLNTLKGFGMKVGKKVRTEALGSNSFKVELIG